jgi:hypothetical protein
VVTIRDLGSSNGTTVNGNPVTSCVLNSGDEVRLGGYRLFLDSGPAGANAAPSEPDPRGVGATVMMDASPAYDNPPLDPATASFDIDPHGTGPSEPVETGNPGAFAPTDSNLDFGGGDDDATPADGAFVPQVAGSAAPSLQPQVISRDGRMYLRDPRTSREMEIVPRPGGGSPAVAGADLSGYYAEQEASDRKKNLWLIGGAIGVGLLMIITLASLQSGPTEDNQGQKQKAFPRAKYNELCEQSVEAMVAGDFDAAKKLLRPATREYPDYQVSKILADIGKQWEQSGKSVEEFDWLSVEPLLRALESSRWATAKVKSFAEGRIDWVYDVENQQAIVARAIKLKADGKPEEALREMQKVPRKSIVWEKSKHLHDEFRGACFQAKIQAARQALRSQNWTSAIAHANKADAYATDVQKAEITRIVREASARNQEQVALRNANALAHTGRLSSAEEALRGVDDAGPYAKKKQNLLRWIRSERTTQERDRRLSRARQAYQNGNGAQAVELITRHDLTELYGLRERVAQLKDLFKEVDQALSGKQKDWELAKSKLLEIQQVETDHTNAYNKRAVTRLREIMDRRRDVASDYKQRGDKALLAGKLREARDLYLRAMGWDNLAQIGKDGLDQLRHIAKLKYSKARDLRYEGRTKWPEALRLFHEVQQCVGPINELHGRAARQAAEIRAKMEEEQD